MCLLVPFTRSRARCALFLLFLLLLGLHVDVKAQSQEVANPSGEGREKILPGPSDPEWDPVLMQADSLLKVLNERETDAAFEERMARIAELADSLPADLTEEAKRLHFNVIRLSHERRAYSPLYYSMGQLSLRPLQPQEIQRIDSLAAFYWPYYRETVDEVQKGEFLSLAGYYANRSNRHQRGLDLLREALPLAAGASDSAGIYVNMGSALSRQGNLGESTQAFIRALDLYTLAGDSARVWRVNANLGVNAEISGNLDRAYEYVNRAVEMAWSLGDSLKVLESLSNLAVIHEKADSVQQALRTYEQALEMAREIGNVEFEARNLVNMSSIFREQGRYDEALRLSERSLRISREGRMAQGVLVNLANMAEIESDRGRHQVALAHLTEAKQFAEMLDRAEFTGRLLFQTSVVQERLGNHAEALAAFKEGQAIKDSVLNATTLRDMEEIQTRYEVREIEQRIEAQRAEIETQTRTIRLLALSAALLLGIIVLSVSFLQLRNRQLRLLYEKNVQDLHKHYLTRHTDGVTPPWEAVEGDVYFAVREMKSMAEPDGGADLDEADGLEADYPNQTDRLYNRLLRALHEQKYYTDASLTLADLARKMGTNTQYLSRAINQRSGMNFNQFLNQYRVYEAKRIMLEQRDETGWKTCSTDELMELTGFNTRSTFFSAFKSITGMTPGQFSKMRS